MGEPIVILRAECRVCTWSDGAKRAWVVTYDGFKKWPRCPFCGAKKPTTKIIHGP